MKIVLTKNIEYDFDSVWVVPDDGNADGAIGDEYVQISEVIDVDFPLVDHDISAKKIEAIDKKISKAEAGIHLLKQAKAELLAITDMSTE